MYNCLYQYLKDEKILYKKQFGFQTGHSIGHAIVKLTDQIHDSFEKNDYTLGLGPFYLTKKAWNICY